MDSFGAKVAAIGMLCRLLDGIRNAPSSLHYWNGVRRDPARIRLKKRRNLKVSRSLTPYFHSSDHLPHRRTLREDNRLTGCLVDLLQ